MGQHSSWTVLLQSDGRLMRIIKWVLYFVFGIGDPKPTNFDTYF